MYQALAEDFPVAQLAKNLPMMQETRVRFLGQEDPLEKEMAVHSSILAWRSPWTEKSGGLQFMGHKEWDTTERLTHTHTHTHTHTRARAHAHTHTSAWWESRGEQACPVPCFHRILLLYRPGANTLLMTIASLNAGEDF